jgi:hypothetical protein
LLPSSPGGFEGSWPYRTYPCAKKTLFFQSCKFFLPFSHFFSKYAPGRVFHGVKILLFKGNHRMNSQTLCWYLLKKNSCSTFVLSIVARLGLYILKYDKISPFWGIKWEKYSYHLTC